MRVNSIFESCQGEGVNAGIPMTFIRLQGCNLTCSFCDSKETWSKNSREMTVIDIAHDVGSRLPVWACITGGEPFLQELELKELVLSLIHRGMKVEIETNGSFPFPLWGIDSTLYRFVTDIKCPSSGYAPLSDVVQTWLLCGGYDDSIKFVVGSIEDLQYVDYFRAMYMPDLFQYKGTVIVSPVFPFDVAWVREVWKFCVLRNLRFSLQVHKTVWGNKKER